MREQLIKVQLPLQYEEMLCIILTQLHSRDPLFSAFAPNEYDWITSIYLKRYFWKLYSPWFLQQSADEAVGILSGQRLRDVVAIGPLYIYAQRTSIRSKTFITIVTRSGFSEERGTLDGQLQHFPIETQFGF